MRDADFDLLIVGGGLAGASLACALRGSRFRIGLLDRRAPTVAPGWDARLYALSPASRDFLGQCGVWDHLPAERVQAVERMEVFGDAGGRLEFSAYEAGLDALAWIAEGGRLAHELWQTASRQAKLSLIVPAEPQALRFEPDHAALTLSDGRVLRASLVVGADGAESWVRAQAGLAADARPYADQGVVANFACERPHGGTAFQWFRPDGVLAWLPLPGNQISMVWSTSSDLSAELVSSSPEVLAKRVADAGANRLGRLERITPAAVFPLRWMNVPETIRARLALIGDAAHAIHPLSGHGINLGFQDARVLAEVLQALPDFRDCGALPVLQRYERARIEEVALLRGVTHGLHGLFAARSPLLATLRNAGLSLTGRVPFVRAAMTRYAAGLL